jgi:hypothetical protein
VSLLWNHIPRLEKTIGQFYAGGIIKEEEEVLRTPMFTVPL